jgi:hypothetical protein
MLGRLSSPHALSERRDRARGNRMNVRAARRVGAATFLAMAFSLPAMAQSNRPKETPAQKACFSEAQKYIQNLHLEGASLFGAHYDPVARRCMAEYVVIAGGVTQLSIDDTAQRRRLALFEVTEKTDKVMKCYVLSTHCASEGVFLTLSRKVFRWVTF